MNIYLKNVTVAFASVLFGFSLMFHSAQCSRSSTQLGSPFRLDDREIELHQNITRLIEAYSYVGDWYWCYDLYGKPYTDFDNIYHAASGYYADHSISFYIGEGRYTYLIGFPLNLDPQYFITTWNGSKVYDWTFFDNSTSEFQHVKLAFLWSCEQGDTIGGSYCPIGPRCGMPYAWLGTTELSGDGYADADAGTQAFIGFAGVAPWLLRSDWVELGDPLIPRAGYKFLASFYFYALCRGADNSINDALDHAASDV